MINDNDGPYKDPLYAIEDFNCTEAFGACIHVDLELKHIEAVQKMVADRYGYKLPSNYVIEMLTRDFRIATEAWHDSFDDTDARGRVLDYLAEDVVGVSWPCNGNTDEYKSTFHAKFADGVKERGWL